MNILEWIVNKTGIELNSAIGRAEYKKIEETCDKYYGRFLRAHGNQYVIGTPPPILTFLALDSDCVKVLDYEPGSLVRHKGNKCYYIVDEWGMSGNHATIKGHDKDGSKMVIGAAEFEPADIPSEVIGLAMNQLRKKCPLLCGKEGEENEG